MRSGCCCWIGLAQTVSEQLHCYSNRVLQSRRSAACLAPDADEAAHLQPLGVCPPLAALRGRLLWVKVVIERHL